MPETWTKLLFTYGPFALLVLFVFVIEGRARSFLSQDSGKRFVGVLVYLLTWAAIFSLCVVIVFVWMRLNVPDQEATIRGRIIGLDVDAELRSPFEDMYLRRVYGAQSRLDFVWRIISRQPLPTGTAVNLYLDRSVTGHEDVKIYEFPIESDFYKQEVVLVYEPASGRLLLHEPSGSLSPLKQVAASNLPHDDRGGLRTMTLDMVPRAYAQSSVDLATISKRLEADDPVIRVEARSDLAKMGNAAVPYIEEVLTDPGSSYRLRLGAIVALTHMADSSQKSLSTYATCKLRRRPMTRTRLFEHKPQNM